MSSSYSAARVHAMRAKLITSYKDLLKMSDSEIIRFLQTTEYNEDVQTLSLKDLNDLEAFDKVLASNNRRTMKKLWRISSEEFKEALQEFLQQNDRWNILIIAKAISGGEDPQTALDLYERVGTINPRKFIAKTHKELARAAKKYFPHLIGEEDSLTQLQSKLIQDHYAQRALVDEHNVLTIIKCKRDGVAENIKIIPHGSIQRSMLNDAAGAKSVEEALQILSNSYFKRECERALEEFKEGTLARFEGELRRAALDRMKHMMSKDPLSSEIVVQYLVQKELEQTNLRLLVKGKRLNLSEEFIQERLIT